MYTIQISIHIVTYNYPKLPPSAVVLQIAIVETHKRANNRTRTNKMQGLDFGGGWNGELVLWGYREGSVTVAELSKDVDLRHIIPDGLHKLQVRRLNSLTRIKTYYMLPRIT